MYDTAVCSPKSVDRNRGPIFMDVGWPQHPLVETPESLSTDVVFFLRLRSTKRGPPHPRAVCCLFAIFRSTRTHTKQSQHQPQTKTHNHVPKPHTRRTHDDGAYFERRRRSFRQTKLWCCARPCKPCLHPCKISNFPKISIPVDTLFGAAAETGPKIRGFACCFAVSYICTVVT